MKLPLPKSADNVSHRITSGTQTAEYKSSEKAWYWTIAKLQGGREVSATVKVNVNYRKNMAMQYCSTILLHWNFSVTVLALYCLVASPEYLGFQQYTCDWLENVHQFLNQSEAGLWNASIFPPFARGDGIRETSLPLKFSPSVHVFFLF